MKLEHEIVCAIKKHGAMRPSELAIILGKRRAEVAAACMPLILTDKLSLNSELRVELGPRS